MQPLHFASAAKHFSSVFYCASLLTSLVGLETILQQVNLVWVMVFAHNPCPLFNHTAAASEVFKQTQMHPRVPSFQVCADHPVLEL